MPIAYNKHNQIDITPGKQGKFRIRKSIKPPCNQRSICVPGSAKDTHWQEKEKPKK